MRKTIPALMVTTLVIFGFQPMEAQAEGTEATATQVAKGSYRSGIWGGGGFGAASQGCLESGCDSKRTGGGAWFGRLGGTISPQIRVAGGLNGWAGDTDGVTSSVGTATFQTQWFPSAGNFFLLGGIGAAWADADVDDGSDDVSGGAAFQFGTGYSFNLGSRRKIAIVPEFSWQITTIPGTVDFWQIGVGFFWN